MKFGRLWYDADPDKPLDVKIVDAAKNYYEKNDYYPNVAFVHPSMLEGQNTETVNDISIRTAEHIQPNNIWIGWEE